jgi:hypothetical protein
MMPILNQPQKNWEFVFISDALLNEEFTSGQTHSGLPTTVTE